MAGYPRVIGYAPGTGIYGYVAGADVAPPMLPVMPHMALPVHPAPHPAVHSPPWRPMMAPGSPPLGEGHVPMPLNPETFNGTWGGTSVTGAAPAGTTITFSAGHRPGVRRHRPATGRAWQHRSADHRCRGKLRHLGQPETSRTGRVDSPAGDAHGVSRGNRLHRRDLLVARALPALEGSRSPGSDA